MSLAVRVVAPDKTVWDAEAEEVVLPSTTGQLGILSGHAPLLTALDIGVLRVRADKDWVAIALMGGFAEVENNEVTILVNGAEKGDNIDLSKAQADYTSAKSEVDGVSADDKQAVIRAKKSLKKARARVQAAGGSL
ncbi:MAG: ATP synthase F1 subunit epsilon [Cyanobacteria bacterium P01_H01_bin.105]